MNYIRMKCVYVLESTNLAMARTFGVRTKQIFLCTRVYPEVSGLSHNKINSHNNNKHSLRSNTKGCGGKTHYTDSRNSDTTASRGRKLYHLQFSLQAASPETSTSTSYFCLNKDRMIILICMPGREADHSPQSSAECYTSSPPIRLNGVVIN
jgi:hypothetical protein